VNQPVHSFKHLGFLPLTLKTQPDLEPFLQAHPQSISGYTFAMLMAWNHVYQYEWHFLTPRTLLVSYFSQDLNQRHFLQPIGFFDKDVEVIFSNLIKNLPYSAHMVGVTSEFCDTYFDFIKDHTQTEEPASFNYIYHTQDLATLAGHKYTKKRNLIHQAESLYQYTVHDLTPCCKPECIRILSQIAAPNTDTDIPTSLKNELQALETTMEHLAVLKQHGLMLKVDNKPVAFSIFEPINQQTMVIHFEKAERSYKGIYQLINYETAKKISALGYALINREEDLGIAGLRQAKQSYFPCELKKVYRINLAKS